MGSPASPDVTVSYCPEVLSCYFAVLVYLKYKWAAGVLNAISHSDHEHLDEHAEFEDKVRDAGYDANGLMKSSNGNDIDDKSYDSDEGYEVDERCAFTTRSSHTLVLLHIVTHLYFITHEASSSGFLYGADSRKQYSRSNQIIVQRMVVTAY